MRNIASIIIILIFIISDTGYSLSDVAYNKANLRAPLYFEQKRDILLSQIIDSLPVFTDEWQVLQKVKFLKADSATASLFRNWSYGKMMEVISRAGRLPKNRLQQAERLGTAYDFYLKDPVKSCISQLKSISDEWSALETAKSLKTDSRTASLFENLDYSSMMVVFSIADKLPRKKLQQAERLGTAYAFYLNQNIKSCIDEIGPIRDQWLVLQKVRFLKTNRNTASLFKNLGYSSMMVVLSVAGILPRNKLPQAQFLGAATEYYLARKRVLINLFKEAYLGLNPEDRRLLLADLAGWNHKSRPKFNDFKGIGMLIRTLLEPKYENRFPYIEDIKKPVKERRYLAEGTRKIYLIVALSMISQGEFINLISENKNLELLSSTENLVPIQPHLAPGETVGDKAVSESDRLFGSAINRYTNAYLRNITRIKP